MASVSKRLGVSSNQLYKWKSLYLNECSANSKAKPDFKEVVAENERLRKELRRAERANEFKKNGGLLREGRVMRYRRISESEGFCPVEEMCSILEVSRSGYYDWKGREPSARNREDGPLREAISRIYRLSKGRYGHRPIHAHLQEEGLDCGRWA